jgi:hypothetical protein
MDSLETSLVFILQATVCIRIYTYRGKGNVLIDELLSTTDRASTLG